MPRAARRLELKGNTTFFRQGQEATRSFVLLAGRVKISKITPDGHQIVVRYAGPEALFGCVPLFGGDRYPGTAAAVAECTSLSWDRSTAHRLTECFPRMAINALHLLSAELATQRVEQRPAMSLLRHVGQAGKRVEDFVLIGFSLSHQDLAELTGTTLPTVSRILSAWERCGIIWSGRRKIVIWKPLGQVTIAKDLSTGGAVLHEMGLPPARSLRRARLWGKQGEGQWKGI